jgi:hypothetical protein
VEKTPISQSQKQIEVRVQSALLPRPTKDSKPIIITSSDTNMIAADLLKWEKVKRTSQIPSKQALILVDLLGGDTATWQLAFVMFPTGRDTKSKGLAGSFTNIQIQARVLYIDFFTLQQVCFRLTTGTLEALTEHHRNFCCDDLKAHSYGDVRIEAEIKGSIRPSHRALYLLHRYGLS